MTTNETNTKVIELPKRKELDAFEMIKVFPNLGMRAVYLPDVEYGQVIEFYSEDTPGGLKFISEFELPPFGKIAYDAGPLFDDEDWAIDYATGVFDKHMNMIYTNDVVLLPNGHPGTVGFDKELGEFIIDIRGGITALTVGLTRFDAPITTLGRDYD